MLVQPKTGAASASRVPTGSPYLGQQAGDWVHEEEGWAARPLGWRVGGWPKGVPLFGMLPSVCMRVLVCSLLPWKTEPVSGTGAGGGGAGIPANGSRPGAAGWGRMTLVRSFFKSFVEVTGVLCAGRPSATISSTSRDRGLISLQ